MIWMVIGVIVAANRHFLSSRVWLGAGALLEAAQDAELVVGPRGLGSFGGPAVGTLAVHPSPLGRSA